jgi:hypothetical protein
MSEQRLSHLIVDAEALEASGESVPEVTEVQVLDLCQLTDPSPILLEGSDIIPATEHPVRQRSKGGDRARPNGPMYSGA